MPARRDRAPGAERVLLSQFLVGLAPVFVQQSDNLHASRQVRFRFDLGQSKVPKPLDHSRDFRRHVARRIGPDGQIAPVIDLFERAQVLFPQ